MKIITRGLLLNGYNSFLLSFENVLDAIIVLNSLLYFNTQIN